MQCSKQQGSPKKVTMLHCTAAHSSVSCVIDITNLNYSKNVNQFKFW